MNADNNAVVIPGSAGTRQAFGPPQKRQWPGSFSGGPAAVRHITSAERATGLYQAALVAGPVWCARTSAFDTPKRLPHQHAGRAQVNRHDLKPV
jgi:hypothetical protein